MEQIIFWAVTIFVILTIIGLIAEGVERLTGRKKKAPPAPMPPQRDEVQGDIYRAMAASVPQVGAPEDEVEPEGNSPLAPVYNLWWVIAADRVGSKREDVMAAVANTLLGHADRTLIHEAEYFWEYTYGGEWVRDRFIAEQLVHGGAGLSEEAKPDLIAGALMIALLHDPEGDKYMVDKTAYGRERAKIVSEIRGLCLDWYGSRGEALFEEKLAAAKSAAQPIADQYGFSVGSAT